MLAGAAPPPAQRGRARRRALTGSSARRTPTAASAARPASARAGCTPAGPALGLAAAGRNPRDVRRGGADVLDYVRAHPPGRSGDLGEIARTILLLRAAGLAPRDRRRATSCASCCAKRARGSGSFAGRVNTTAFAILALRAAGRSRDDRAVRAGARWIAGQANPDGGFNFAGRGGSSGIDDTGAALQGLVAGRAPRHADGAPRRALPRPPPEPRRRLPAAARRALQRPVDRVGGPGPRRRRAQPRPPAPQRRALADRVPALARHAERRGPLLAHQRADAGLGHRAGARRARPQAVPARPGAARGGPRRGDARAADARADGEPPTPKRPRGPKPKPKPRPRRPSGRATPARRRPPASSRRSRPRPASRATRRHAPRAGRPTPFGYGSRPCGSASPPRRPPASAASRSSPTSCASSRPRATRSCRARRGRRRRHPRRRLRGGRRDARRRASGTPTPSSRSPRRPQEETQRLGARLGADRLPRPAHQRRRACRRSPRPARPRSRWRRSRASRAPSRWTRCPRRRPSPATSR